MKAKLLLFIALFSVILSQAQEINLKQGSTDFATGTTYNFAATVLNATTTVPFTVENTGVSALLISGTSPRVVISGDDPSEFQITGALNANIGPGASDSFNIRFVPTSLGAKSAMITIVSNDSDEGTYTLLLTGTSTVSATSTISLPSGPSYTYTPTIPYELFQSPNIISPATGFEIITFRINDANNSENLPTILTDLTISISNSDNIRRVALYDGIIELAEEDGAAEVTFNGLSLEAPANGSKTFQVLVTFNQTVTDNQNISIKIKAATAHEDGSSFALATAGGATSSASASVNKIVVTAVALRFVEQPSDASTFVSMSPAVSVEAVDLLGNRDFDYKTAVVLTSTGDFHTAGTAPLNDASNNAVAGLATFPQLIHGAEGTSLFLIASSPAGLLPTLSSDLFDIEAASVENNYFRSAASGLWSDPSSWETSGNNTDWMEATLAPTTASRSINILLGHTITSNADLEADQLTVRGTLKITAGTFTLKKATLTGVYDLAVYGTFEHSGGTFDNTTYGSGVRVVGAGTYLHSKPSSTLTLPIITWSTGSKCEITGLTNSTPISIGNMGQDFGNVIFNNPNQLDFVNINDDLFKVRGTLTLETGASNKICLSSTGTHINTVRTLAVKGGEFVGFTGTSNGVLNLTNATIEGGQFMFNNSSAAGNELNISSNLISSNNAQIIFNNSSTSNILNIGSYLYVNDNSKFTFTNASASNVLNIGSNLILNTNGEFTFNNGTGLNTMNVTGYVRLNNNGKFICSNNIGSSTINIGTNFSMYTTSSLVLENTSSTGVTNLVINGNLSSSATSPKAIDFGFGDVSGNKIVVKGNFAKTGAGVFTTSSTTHAPAGFEFTGVNQGFSYTGGQSAGVNFTVNSTGTFTLNGTYVFNSTTSLPMTVFTVNSPILNLRNYTFSGNSTKARFNIANGITIQTIHGNGLGGNVTRGNFTNFGSIGGSPADGRVSFGTGLNYNLDATNTTTPFPVGGTWPIPNNIIIGGAPGILTINYTTPFSLNGALSINAGKTLRLNPTAGAHLNLKNALIIDGTLDTNGENQVVDAGAGIPTITINGTFLTKDAQGFNGANASVPTIAVTIGDDGIVNYGGTNQTITAFSNYKNLVVSGTGVKTLASTITTIGKTLNVTSSLLKIADGQTLKVADAITTVDTDATQGIVVENNGSLVQVTPIANTANANIGKIQTIRIAKPMFRYDFTYWSSPVGSGYTLSNLSPVTLFDKYFSWNHAAEPQVWQKINYGAEAMVAGRGYSVRAPQSFPIETTAGAVAQVFTANFIGIPNNGTVTQAVTGAATDKWNLLGNPYPSAISGHDFVMENDNVLGGTLYFWTHNTSPAPEGGSGFYYTYNSADYASWNITGGVDTKAASTADAGTNGNASLPSGYIAAGQAFFVKGIANGTAEFNNGMRITGANNQFFKSSFESATTDDNGRVWLNLKGETKGFNQLLVGYVENATNDYDSRFDGESFGGNQVTFYSLVEDKDLVIQGRALPFTAQDQVPLGYKTTLTGNLTIEIDHVDGLMDEQAIYLKDNLLNVVHNLKDSNYTFAATPGTDNTRFVMLYAPEEVLSNPTFADQMKNVTIRKNNETIYINSVYEPINVVSIYDITGRLIFEQKECNTTHFEINSVVQNQQVLVVKVQLNNGGTSTTKVW